MRTATNQIDDNSSEENYIAKEIFSQLLASKVHGFPFFAYTGIKPSIFSTKSLHLKLPKNPSKLKSILVHYVSSTDTYTVEIESVGKKYTDIYADGLADLIVREMGVF